MASDLSVSFDTAATTRIGCQYHEHANNLVARAHSLTPTKVKKVTSGQISLMTVAWNFLTLHMPPEKTGLVDTILRGKRTVYV